MIEIPLPNLEATENLGAKIGRLLAQRLAPCVVGLSGDLGAGKTTLTRAVARGLGIKGPVQSPTFTIERRYPIPPSEERPALPGGQGGGVLRHWDFYRLDEFSDLEELGFYDRAPGDIFFVEWVTNFDEVANDPEVCLIDLLVPQPVDAPDERVLLLRPPVDPKNADPGSVALWRGVAPA